MIFSAQTCQQLISAVFRQSEGLYHAFYSRVTCACSQKTVPFKPVCLGNASLGNPLVCHTIFHLTFCLFLLIVHTTESPEADFN